MPLLLICRVAESWVENLASVYVVRVVAVITGCGVAVPVSAVTVTDDRRHANRDLAVGVGGCVGAVTDGYFFVGARSGFSSGHASKGETNRERSGTQSFNNRHYVPIYERLEQLSTYLFVNANTK